MVWRGFGRTGRIEKVETLVEDRRCRFVAFRCIGSRVPPPPSRSPLPSPSSEVAIVSVIISLPGASSSSFSVSLSSQVSGPASSASPPPRATTKSMTFPRTTSGLTSTFCRWSGVQVHPSVGQRERWEVEEEAEAEVESECGSQRVWPQGRV